MRSDTDPGAVVEVGGGPGQDLAEASPSGGSSKVSRRGPRAGSGGSRKAHPAMFWAGIALVLVALVISGVSDGYLEYRNGQIHHITVRNLSPSPTKGVDAATQNILLIGSTSRCVLNNKQVGAFGSCAAGVNGINSDVIMVLRVDPNRHRVSLISVPRDTFLPNARPGQYNKIDSALVYGPSQLVLAVEQDLGITIQHYVELNFDSFQNVVKALGGISMWFPDPVKDAYSGLNIPKAGCIKLGAFEALAVVRARHMYYEVHGKWYYDGSGDLGRIERVHEFLRVLASALLKRGLANPITDNQLIGALAPDLVVDQGFTPKDMVDLILEMHHLDPYRVPETTLPVINDPTYAYQYQGYDYGAVIFPAEPQDLEAVTSWLGHPVPGAKLAPSSVTVSVLGGVGNPAETAAVAGKLKALGFDVIGTSEQTPVGPVSEASVIYRSAAALPDGNRVLETLNGAVALGEGATLDHADVTVVTGTSFSVDAPKLAATTVAQLGSLGRSSKAGVAPVLSLGGAATRVARGAIDLTSAELDSAATALGPPTSASQPLPPYDPRACPASAKG